MIVVDASAMVELLLGSRRGEGVLERLRDVSEPNLQAPALIDIEVAHAFSRMVAAGSVEEPRARASLELLLEMPISRHMEHVLAPRIWALRENLSAYDAAYVALAEALDCPLLTCDRGVASAPGHNASVLVAE